MKNITKLNLGLVILFILTMLTLNSIGNEYRILYYDVKTDSVDIITTSNMDTISNDYLLDNQVILITAYDNDDNYLFDIDTEDPERPIEVWDGRHFIMKDYDFKIIKQFVINYKIE